MHATSSTRQFGRHLGRHFGRHLDICSITTASITASSVTSSVTSRHVTPHHDTSRRDMSSRHLLFKTLQHHEAFQGRYSVIIDIIKPKGTARGERWQLLQLWSSWKEIYAFLFLIPTTAKCLPSRTKLMMIENNIIYVFKWKMHPLLCSRSKSHSSINVINHDQCHQKCDQIQCYSVIYHFEYALVSFSYLSLFQSCVKVLWNEKARWCLENTSELLLADTLSAVVYKWISA